MTIKVKTSIKELSAFLYRLVATITEGTARAALRPVWAGMWCRGCRPSSLSTWQSASAAAAGPGTLSSVLSSSVRRGFVGIPAWPCCDCCLANLAFCTRNSMPAVHIPAGSSTAQPGTTGGHAADTCAWRSRWGSVLCGSRKHHGCCPSASEGRLCRFGAVASLTSALSGQGRAWAEAPEWSV